MGDHGDQFAAERKIAKVTQERDEAREQLAALRAAYEARENCPPRSAAFVGEIVHTTTTDGGW